MLSCCRALPGAAQVWPAQLSGVAPCVTARAVRVQSQLGAARMTLSDATLAAATGGDIRAIEAALASGTDVNDLGCYHYDDDCTMLTLAAENCQHEVAKLLLVKGANPNLIDDDLRPALHKAGDAQMVDLLVVHGAIVDGGMDEVDETALFAQACNYLYSNIDCVRALLRHGTDFTLENFEGHTARSSALLMSQAPRWEGGEGWEAGQGRLHETIDLLTAVEAAGSWKRYVRELREPVVQLLCLRYLCLAGRARPPAYNTLLVRLFGAPPVANAAKARRAANLLPNEVFAHILTFWNRRT